MDILVFVNTIINYAVLITAEKLLKISARTWRIICASITGALFSPLIFLDLRSPVLSVLIKAASSAALCGVAFAGKSLKGFAKQCLMTLCVSFLFSGMMIAAYQLFDPPNMLIVNDIVYFHVNPLLLLALTGVIYVFVCAIERIFRERIRGSVVRLSFTVGGSRYACPGKIDTGCALTEPFSGDPVIIADHSVLTIPEGAARRVIPYRTIAASSLLYAVHADAVSIDGKPVLKSVYIAEGNVQNSAYQSIINSDLLR